MQDRIRLKLNPTNVATPSNSRDLYINAAGELVKESPGGVKEVIGAGGSATVDNASVVTAIEENPAAVLEALGIDETLVFDYLQTADAAETTIPANAFGRKGSTPYFGESPLSDGESVTFTGAFSSTGTPARTLVASIPLTAAQMVANEFLFLDFSFLFTHGSSADEWSVWLDFDEGVDNTTGLELKIRPVGTSLYSFIGQVMVFDASGLLGVTAGTITPVHNSAAGFGVTANFDDWNEASFGSTGVATPGVANHLNIYIADVSAENTETISYGGRIKIISQ